MTNKVHTEIQKAIGQVGAEYKYAEILLAELVKISKLEKVEEKEREIRKGIHIAKWLGRGTKKLDQLKEKIIEELKETLSPEELTALQPYQKEFNNQIKLITTLSSRYEGKIPQILKKILALEEVEKLDLKKNKPIETEEREIKQFLEETQKMIRELEDWLSAVGINLGRIDNVLAVIERATEFHIKGSDSDLIILRPAWKICNKLVHLQENYINLDNEIAKQIGYGSGKSQIWYQCKKYKDDKKETLWVLGLNNSSEFLREMRENS